MDTVGTSSITKWEWLKNVFRFTYTLPFVLASLTGVFTALVHTPQVVIGVFIVLDVFVLALFVNLSNDYFDHKSGADSSRFFSRDKEFERGAKEILNSKLYWSGNAFDLGYVTESEGKTLMALLAGLAILLSIPIVIHGGIIVILLGLIAFFLSYFYTAPPMNLGARGLGEFDVFLSFFMISFFSFFVTTGFFSYDAFLVALSVGLLVMNMRLVDEMSGYEAHLEAGEKDLCVRLGLRNASKLVVIIMFLIYLISVINIAISSIFYLLVFLSIPFSYKISRTLFNESDRFRYVRPAPLAFMLSFSFQLLIIIASILRIYVTSG
ncbi:MAG: prenyltransferase [Methanomassiliicoccales archaeon]|jgi:1,4-dihydroxy-2-naphthoate octaprenyltransferase|nr:prenyltransferase [Methanomassiliicoccales archaeon]